ncbi:MAG: hypothetical protein QOH90_1294 [Actinomycetota bacterium]|nr:hypothetical protein [Actinomycetota bacterium]
MATGDETCGEDVTTPDDVLGDSEEAGPTPDDVLGLVIKRGSKASPQVQADTVAQAAGEALNERAALPFTGGDILPLLFVGLALIFTGVMAARFRRQSR